MSPWELDPWARLPERFERRCLVLGACGQARAALSLPRSARAGDNGPHLSPDGVQPAAERAGVPWATPHMMRHGAATLMAERGARHVHVALLPWYLQVRAPHLHQPAVRRS